MTVLKGILLICALGSAAALADVPACDSGQQVLSIDNSQVLQWKTSTPNQYHNRAHIKGTLVQVYRTHDRRHDHMEVQIGPNATDTIEVVYNDSFGPLANLQSGDSVEACGDYITSDAPTNRYPASPDGAIMHWIHASSNSRHDSGFLVINGTVYGQGAGFGFTY